MDFSFLTTTKKNMRLSNKPKVMLISFFNYEGVVHHEAKYSTRSDY